MVKGKSPAPESLSSLQQPPVPTEAAEDYSYVPSLPSFPAMPEMPSIELPELPELPEMPSISMSMPSFEMPSHPFHTAAPSAPAEAQAQDDDATDKLETANADSSWQNAGEWIQSPSWPWSSNSTSDTTTDTNSHIKQE